VFEIDLENAFDFNSAEYASLFEQSRASAFQHPLWLDAMYRSLIPSRGATPLVVVARTRAEGRLAMVLPLLRRKRYGMRVVEFADLGLSDYAAAVCNDADFEALAQDQQARQRIRSLVRPFDLIRITKIRDDSQRLERLFASARRDAMGMEAHATPLFAPYPDWRAANVPLSHARNYAKKRRQLGRLGAVKFERLHEPEAAIRLLRDLQKFRGQRYPDDLLRDESYFKFYGSVTLAGLASGFVRAYRTSLDGCTLSAAWGLSHHGRFLILVTGFDETHAHRSPGALAFEDIAADCIAEQDATLDFTCGNEGYKGEIFGAVPSRLWMVLAGGTALGVAADTVAARFALGGHRRKPQAA